MPQGVRKAGRGIDTLDWLENMAWMAAMKHPCLDGMHFEDWIINVSFVFQNTPGVSRHGN